MEDITNSNWENVFQSLESVSSVNSINETNFVTRYITQKRQLFKIVFAGPEVNLPSLLYNFFKRFAFFRTEFTNFLANQESLIYAHEF